MKTITVEMVRSWGPCYDPTDIVPEGWTGTALDVLNLPISADDKLWVVLRPDCLPERLLHEFALWCTEFVRHLMTDQRSTYALDMKRRWLDGKATDKELDAVRAAAWAAAVAARAAAGDAACAETRAETRAAQVEKLKEMI